MGFGFLLIGFILLAIWLFQSRRAGATQNWSSVPGRVMDSRLVETRDAEDGRTWTASVTYVYQIGGAQFQGNRVAIGGGKGSPQQIVQRYPAGAVVPVFYDPQKPAAAVLERGSGGLTPLLIIAIAMCVAGLAIIVGGRILNGGSQHSYSQAVDLYNNKDYAGARTAFEQLARNGNDQAKVYLGVMYTKGQGVPQDFVEGQKWFILAGDAGKKNSEVVKKGLTAAQEEQAERAAREWK